MPPMLSGSFPALPSDSTPAISPHTRLHLSPPPLCLYLLQLLKMVLTRGEVTEMMTLAVTAAQCMNKVAISKEIREFTHKGKAEGKLQEKVRAEQT